MARACTGPKAEGPNLATGSTIPTAVLASSSIRLLSESASMVRKLPSAAATSTFSLRGNFTGTMDFEEEDELLSSGRSSGVPRWTGEGGAEASS